jgi:predicted amidohydrolase YtcJ
VDVGFSVREAMAVSGGRVALVGSDEEVGKLKGARTQVIDLAGRMVLPGLIDSHVHSTPQTTEFDHPIPDMESVADVLKYVAGRAAALGEGKWIEVRQVFITRLKEQRYPTRAELDKAAPKNPVIFATGPDASINSIALKTSGIDRNFKVTDGGAGYIEKDEQGEPTGILRNCTRFVKVESPLKSPKEDDHLRRTVELFKDYNSVGITAVGDRSGNAGSIARYQKLLERGELTVRVSISHHVDNLGPLPEIQKRIRAVAEHPLRKPDPMLQIVGIKMFLDGGMLTGSAYMREPWGVSEIYAIKDPAYRGLLFIPKERLLPMVRTAVESGLQFTAHSVGDGAVHTLLEAYEEIGRELPGIRATRPCITHCNFMSREAVEKLAELGAVADIQPAWLYLDTRTLVKQFGYDRLRYFQPLRSLAMLGGIAGGGSDHMQKIGSLRSINPYNPFLGMATTITRQAKWFDKPLHPAEALSRPQAIRFYTANNAHLLFREKEIGTLEPGKFADFIVLDNDILACPDNKIAGTQVLETWLAGKRVFQRAQ